MILIESFDNTDVIRKIIQASKAFFDGDSDKMPSGKTDGIQYWIDKDAVYFSVDSDDSYAAIMVDELRDFKEDDIVNSVVYQLEKTAEDAENLD